jgi:Peptidase propeptide and YPEB domain
MSRRTRVLSLALAVALCASAALPFAPAALAKDGGGESGHGGGSHGDGGGDHGGGGHSGGAGHDGGGGTYGDAWDTSGSSDARRAVDGGAALSLNKVLPTVGQAVPGSVLDVDLQRLIGGGWVYKFRVLTADGTYMEVFVDAIRNRVLQVRRR